MHSLCLLHCNACMSTTSGLSAVCHHLLLATGADRVASCLCCSFAKFCSVEIVCCSSVGFLYHSVCVGNLTNDLQGFLSERLGQWQRVCIYMILYI